MSRRFYFIFCITMFIMTRVRMMTAETKNILMNNDSVGPLLEQPEIEPQRYSGPGSSLGITYERRILADKTARNLLRTLSLSPEFAKYGMNSPTTESKQHSLLEPLKTSNPTHLPIPHVPVPSKPPDPSTVSSPPEQPTLPTSDSQQGSLLPSTPPGTSKPVSLSSPSTELSSDNKTPQISPDKYSQKTSQSTPAESPKPVKMFSWSSLFGSKQSKPPVAPTIPEPSKLTGSTTTPTQTTSNEQSASPTPPTSGESSTGNDNSLTHSKTPTTPSTSKNSILSDSLATTPFPSSVTQPQKPSDSPVQSTFKFPSIYVPPKVATPTVSATSVEPLSHTAAPPEVSKQSSKFSFSKLFSWKTTKPTLAETGPGSPSDISPIPPPPLSSSAKPSVSASSTTAVQPASTVNSATPTFPATSAASSSSPPTQYSTYAPAESAEAPKKFRFPNLFWRPAKPATPSSMEYYNPPDIPPSSTALPASIGHSGSATTATPTKLLTQNKVIPPALESPKQSTKYKFPSLFSWKSDGNQLKGPSSPEKSVQGSGSVTPSAFSQPAEVTHTQSTVTPSGAAESSAGIASLESSLEALQSTLFSKLSPSKIPPNSAQDSSLNLPLGLKKPQLPTSPISFPSSWHSTSSSKFSSSFALPSSSSLLPSFSSSSSTTMSTSSSSFTTASTSLGPAQASSEASLPTNENPSGSRVKSGRLSSKINFDDLFGSIMNGISSVRNPGRWSTKRRSISEVGRSLSTTRNLISKEDEELPLEIDAEMEEGENQSTLDDDTSPEGLSKMVNDEIQSKTVKKLNPTEDKDLTPAAQMESIAKDGSSLPNNDKLSANHYKKPSLGPNLDQIRNNLSPTQSSKTDKDKDTHENLRDLNENLIEKRLEDQSTNETECDSKAIKKDHSDRSGMLQEAN